MARIIHETAEVLSNIRLGPGYYRLRLSCHRQYACALPGQFVMIRFIEQIDPLLPRPFSIHRLIKKEDGMIGLEILYKVVGKGTPLTYHYYHTVMRGKSPPKAPTFEAK